MLEVVSNVDFKRLVAILRVIARPGWQKAHPESSASYHYARLVKLINQYHADLASDIIAEFSMMVSDALETDVYLSVYYQASVVDWLMSVIDGDKAKVTLMLVLAYASCEDQMVEIAEAASRTGKAESTIRNLCADGRVPGAQKFGKAWTVPSLWCEINKEQ